MADKLRVQAQIEQMQARYVGTGHADTTKHEWFVNQHRDSLASYVGHPSMLYYFSTAQNQSDARTRAEFLEKMINPCGPPPLKED